MAAAVAARHVYRQWGHGITGHCRPACAAGRPRRRQRPAGLEHCSNTVFDGLSNRTIRSGLSKWSPRERKRGVPYDRLAGGFGNRSKAKFEHVHPVFHARCDGRVCFSGHVAQHEDFLFFARKSTFPAKNTDSVGQRESRGAPTYRLRKEAQSSAKQGSDPTNTRRTARCFVLLGGRGCGGTYGDAVLYSG